MGNKLKHLEFIQAAVNRMASNVFLHKGWTVTLIAALFALAAKDAKPAYALIACIPTFMFLLLDAYFLSQEDTSVSGKSFAGVWSSLQPCAGGGVRSHIGAIRALTILKDSCGDTPSAFGDCLVTTIEPGNPVFFKGGVRSSGN